MSQDDDQQNFILAFLFAIVLGVVAFAVGMGIYGASKAKKAAAVSAARAAASAPAGTASAGAAPASGMSAISADGASVQVEAGVVKFFFASGKMEIAAGADKALADTLAGVKAGKKAVISGFSDASGDPVKNAELSKLRAFAVRDALINLGVKADQLELRKPVDVRANAAGSSADARRVDVTLE